VNQEWFITAINEHIGSLLRTARIMTEQRAQVSLPESHRSVLIPQQAGGRRLWAFMGPGFLVAVGYMDPGNWATGMAAGSAYEYT